jgi:predicted nucleic-acid-binding Zn-ribbon protein
MEKQICPKCKSKNIRLAEGFSKLGDPITTQNLVGWECLDCGYIGKDFFIISKTKPKKK